MWAEHDYKNPSSRVKDQGNESTLNFSAQSLSDLIRTLISSKSS